MKKYAYYSKFDPSKETLMTFNAPSLNEAVRVFATFKDLKQDQFNRLFTVVEDDRS
jgi:hypothetical protein